MCGLWQLTYNIKMLAHTKKNTHRVVVTETCNKLTHAYKLHNAHNIVLSNIYLFVIIYILTFACIFCFN